MSTKKFSEPLDVLYVIDEKSMFSIVSWQQSFILRERNFPLQHWNVYNIYIVYM